jgi:dihydroflavonol-4-reductase
MKATLITGATGLIGTNLVRELASRGERVRVLVRKGSSREGYQEFLGVNGAPTLVEEAYGDILDYGSVRAAMEGVERVYHIAGRVCMGPFEGELTRRINVEGTANVCSAAEDAGVKRLVYTSTVSTVGQGSVDAPADETSVFECSRLVSPYYASKRAGELLALTYTRAMDVVVTNPSVVLGAWDLKPSSGKILTLAAKLGGYLGYPLGAINVVGVRDVVSGHLGAMERGRSGHRYILGHENLTHRELFEVIAEVADLRRPLVPLTPALAAPVVLWGDLLGRWFPRAFENVNSLVIKKAHERQYVSSAKAREELGMSQTPVREAVAEALQWFRATGRLRRLWGR